MKKILLTILLFTASTFLYSQSMNLNNNKIRIVDSTMGLGISPTSRLHVFGNGTTSNLFNVTNDKDATKDSSVVVDAFGNVGIGRTPRTKLDVNGFAKIDSSLAVDQNIYLLGLTSRISFNRGGYIYSPSFLCRFEDMGITVDTALYYAVHDKRALSMDNDSTVSLGDYHLNVDYFGKVGIGTYRPNYKLDVFGNGGTDNLLKVSNDINSTYDSTFVIKSNGYVGIGNNTPYYPLHVFGSSDGGANIYSEYSGSTISSAIKGYASGSYGYGIIGIAGTIGAKGGLFQNTASGIALELKANNGIAINVISGYVIVDSTRFHSRSITLSDNEQYAFPPNLSWKGEIDVDSLGYTLFTAQIRCDANSTPYLEGVSWKRWSSKTYVQVGSLDGYLNIIGTGSNNLVITNTLGYTIKATLRFRTKQ